jgi:hypothetical protein
MIHLRTINKRTVRLETPANNNLIDVYEIYGYTKEMYNHKTKNKA